MNNEKIYIPPIKTQGIKTKLVRTIKDNVCLDDDTVWIEPFMGSGVVGLNIAPRKAVFADINPHIIDFYNQLSANKINSNIVAEYLREQGALLSEKSEKHYYYIREKFNKDKDPLDFLFLNRSCFNGLMRFNKKNKYNVPYGHKPERFSKAYITKIVNQVKYFEKKIKENDWVFLCQNFDKTIELADYHSFIYCDPPYIGRHIDYYDSWDEEHEQKLYECLTNANAKFMLSTWEANMYRENGYIGQIWGACYKMTFKHFYFVGASEENRNPMTEALITNYRTTGNTNTVEYPETKYQQLELNQYSYA